MLGDLVVISLPYMSISTRPIISHMIHEEKCMFEKMDTVVFADILVDVWDPHELGEAPSMYPKITKM